MFYFSKSDRRAFILLAILAIGIVVVLCLLPQNEHDKHPTQPVSDSTQHDATSHAASLNLQQPAEHFDPNTVDSITLVKLGLTRYQVRAFLNYRASGFVFEQPLDITHLNSLSDDDIDRLLPLISIADKYRNRRVKYPIGKRNSTSYSHNNSAASYTRKTHTDSIRSLYPTKFINPTKVDPNTADTTLLMKIPGIGRNIARWIVDRRQRLGGFHHVEQLLEVDYVSDDMLEWFEISDTAITHININKAPFVQLSKFPYIGYDKARAISNRIRLYGPFADINALQASGIFDADEIDCLKPYIEY